MIEGWEEIARGVGTSSRNLRRWAKAGAPVEFDDDGRPRADPEAIREWRRNTRGVSKAKDGKPAARTSPGRPHGSGIGPYSKASTRALSQFHESTRAEVAEETGADKGEVSRLATEARKEVEAEFDGTDVKEKLIRAELRKRLAAAEKAERENEVARGNLISREEVERERLARIAAVKHGLLQLPPKLSARVPGLSAHQRAQAEADWDREVRALLTEFAGGEVPE